jgi:uncharacterized protein (DUF427 family)
MADELRMEDCPKRVRGVLDGRFVLDTLGAKYVWEDRPYPGFWFPRADVDLDAIPAAAIVDHGDFVHVKWKALDHWLEEDEEVYVHPRDPHSRVDILQSTRRVRVALKGVTVAETDQPRILFETGLPPRYYLPLTGVRLDLLRPSDHQTMCPYKGTASYWHVEVDGELFENIVWTYKAPLPESQKIAGLVCFYNERVDLTIERANVAQ